jgi:hypothetical protein
MVVRLSHAIIPDRISARVLANHKLAAMLSSWRRSVLAAVVAVGLLLANTSMAHGAVKVYDDSESATLLGQVRKAKCKLKRDQDGKYFLARGESPNGDFSLDVNILDWQGFKSDYTFYLGVQDPNFFVSASYGVFSNVFEIPGLPPGSVGAGGAEFRKGGKILRLGAYLAPSSDLSSGVKFAGGMKCKYPRGAGP